MIVISTINDKTTKISFLCEDNKCISWGLGK